ncbi:GTPase domain-containing protein [candidate division KSB1 bacterium]|nr:GTPase domain-containing protein [candidate division KSB1 bacterium]
MRIINQQIYFKVLFFGTALAGKTTTLNWAYKNIIPESMKSSQDVRSVKTSFGQTMLFDFVPIRISENIHIRFFTATGQDYYAGTRKMLFQDIDGVFFVVDSQKQELEHNKEFVTEFYQHLNSFVLDVNDLSIIVLYNKQDLTEIYPADFLSKELQLEEFPSYPTCAVDGSNIKGAFSHMVQLCLKKLESLRVQYAKSQK